MEIVMDGAVLLFSLFLISGGAEAANNGNSTTTIFSYSMSPSFEPSSGVVVGEVARLTCTLRYSTETPDQKLQLTLLIGNTEIGGVITSEDELFAEGSNWYVRLITNNRTIQSSDSGKVLTCRLMTHTLNATTSISLFFRSPTTSVQIEYKTANKDNTCCQTYDVLNCSANGYPYPTVTWRDENGQIIPSRRNVNNYSILKVTKEGTYTWSCTANNQFSPQPVSSRIVIKNGDSANGVELINPNGFHVLSFLFIGLTLLCIE